MKISWKTLRHLKPLGLVIGVVGAGFWNVSLAQTIDDTAKGLSQTAVTTVEVFGTITANQIVNGLGFNLDDNNDWEFAAAAAAGATHARMQCPWVNVEQQTAPPNNAPANPQYIQDKNCLAGFASAKKYGIHPTVVAAFGPPYHQILTVTIPNGAAVGATSLNIEFVSGVGGDTLSKISFPYDYIQGPPHQAPTYGVFTAAGSYQGAFITGVKLQDSNHATLKLASAVTAALPANSTQYAINEVLYPSAATSSPTDPSVIAFGNYVSFLASSMASAGVSGDVELWNEPPWTPDPWDNRGALYDADLWPGPSKPGPSDAGEPNFGFVGNLQDKTLPPGITLTWNGTSGNGEASILASNMVAESGVYANQPANVVTSESFHPYGYEPEQFLFQTQCLEATAAAYPSYPAGVFTKCYLPGEPTGTNLMAAIQYSMIDKLNNPNMGVAHSVTETGILPPVAGLRAAQARFIMRQYLGFEADGVTPVEFFKLWDASAPNDPNFSFVEYTSGTSFTPNPSYTAIAGFMADIKPIGNLPVASYSAASLTSIASYSGTFPLATVHMVGARAGANANSEMLAVWQRSHANENQWLQMTSPSPGTVSVNVPAGMSVSAVRNLDTRAAVTHSTSGQQLSFNVADDPIEVLLDPSASAQKTTLSLSTSSASSTYGSPVTLTATLSPNNSGGHVTNGEDVTFYSGSANLATGSLSSGVATLSVQSLPAGTNNLTAKYTGDAYFTASSGSASIAVAPLPPTLTFAPVSNQVYGNPSFTVNAYSTSSGAITYSVVSGPAAVSGNTVTLKGTGTIVLGANQAAAGNYTAASTQTSFTSSPAPASPTVLPLYFLSTTITDKQQGLFLALVPLKGSTPPTGSVEVLDGSTVLGSYPLLYSASDKTGYIVEYLPLLSVGQHAISVLYSGDSNYAAGSSAKVIVTVTN